VSTAQITIRVPTGGFEVGEITALIEGVSFFRTGRDNAPIEAPAFDYISFSLGSQGTSRIPFERGEKVGLFSFTNTGICPDGDISLINNLTDPFFPPNSRQSNAGQQMTVSGFGGPDLPIGILGGNISCNPMAEIPPVDTMEVIPPVDTIVTEPVDTTPIIPIDTMVTLPMDTSTISIPVSNSVIFYELELDADDNYIVSQDPGFDYLSFGLVTQGTSRITFQQGEKVGLFSFQNIGACPDGTLSLMDNLTDPFAAPNSRQTNPGQQMTVSGFGAVQSPAKQLSIQWIRWR